MVILNTVKLIIKINNNATISNSRYQIAGQELKVDSYT